MNDRSFKFVSFSGSCWLMRITLIFDNRWVNRLTLNNDGDSNDLQKSFIILSAISRLPAGADNRLYYLKKEVDEASNIPS